MTYWSRFKACAIDRDGENSTCNVPGVEVHTATVPFLLHLKESAWKGLSRLFLDLGLARFEAP